MRCLSWNCRGIGRKYISSNFNFLWCLVKLDFFCLLEVKVSLDKVPENFYVNHFDNVFCCDPVGRTGALCLCWNDTMVTVNIISSSAKFIQCMVKNLTNNSEQVVAFMLFHNICTLLLGRDT